MKKKLINKIEISAVHKLIIETEIEHCMFYFVSLVCCPPCVFEIAVVHLQATILQVQPS